MSYLQKISLEEANAKLPNDSALLCFASFEKRSITLAEHLDRCKIIKAFVFRNVHPPMDIHNYENFNALCSKLAPLKTLELDLDYPVDLADKIISVLREIISSGIRNLTVDISTFTHEALLILIKKLYEQQANFQSILFVYNGAAKYAKWLSMGCKTIRNVVGYPGRFNPAYKDHMIILTGFEKERTTKLVDSFEPDKLSIGYGCKPTDQNHQIPMERMKDEFSKWFDNLGLPWRYFDFSCTEITETISTIRSIINNGKQENIVLVPLNTKLSTISAALVAINDSRVQVVYPIPEAYNVYYSSPSESFTIINMKEIPEFANNVHSDDKDKMRTVEHENSFAII